MSGPSMGWELCFFLVRSGYWQNTNPTGFEYCHLRSASGLSESFDLLSTDQAIDLTEGFNGQIEVVPPNDFKFLPGAKVF